MRSIDGYAARAWPAGLVAPLNGWCLRYNQGVTRRANSVWAECHSSPYNLAEKIAHVEAWYAERGEPARYQLSLASEPAELDGELAARGYRVTAPTLVQVASLSMASSGGRPPAESVVHCLGTLDRRWLQTYGEAEGIPRADIVARREILARITRPTCYVLVEAGGKAVATGLAVLDGEWAGLFCIAPHQSWRRRGIATNVVRGLAVWALRHQATQVYLQVTRENTGAQELYAQMGFQTLYSYHYREQ